MPKAMETTSANWSGRGRDWASPLRNVAGVNLPSPKHAAPVAGSLPKMKWNRGVFSPAWGLANILSSQAGVAGCWEVWAIADTIEAADMDVRSLSLLPTEGRCRLEQSNYQQRLDLVQRRSDPVRRRPCRRRGPRLPIRR